jgi:hypothetical protein
MNPAGCDVNHSATALSQYIVKYDVNGKCVWGGVYHNASNPVDKGQVGLGVAADPVGNVVVTGYLFGTFGICTAFSSMADDVFVAKLSAPNGSCIGVKQFGTPSDERALDVTVTASGHMVVTGYTHGNIQFGDTALAAVGDEDIFIAKLPPL